MIMKPTNSPTQGQPNPRKIRLKMAFGPLFATENIFSLVGIGFRGNRLQEPNPTNFFANTVIVFQVAREQRSSR